MTNVPPNKEYTIRGDLRFEFSSEFRLGSGGRAAQLRCFGDVEYGAQLFRDFPLLTMDILGAGVNWDVKDLFPQSLPYMKPVRAFREYLIGQLRLALNLLPEASQHSTFSAFWMGINRYISQLNSFKEARSLASQIRSIIEVRIKQAETSHKRDYSQEQTAQDLLKILELLEEQPITQLAFLSGGPLEK